MAKLNLAVLKAHRLEDTSTFGKQSIYLRISAGSVSKTSDVHQDAGTDCALGEIFTLELPPGVPELHIEVIAKHSLTGDESIGTARLDCSLIRDSDGEVLRVPVISKKGSMHGELECTGSISDPSPSAPQLQPPTGQLQQQQQQQSYPYTSSQQQQQRGPYYAPYGQQQQQPPYPAVQPGYPAPDSNPPYPQQQQQQQQPYIPYQQQQQQPGLYQQQPSNPYSSPAGYPPAFNSYPYANAPNVSGPAAYSSYQPPAAAAAAAALSPYPPPVGYSAPQQVAAAAPAQQQNGSSGMGRGSGVMGTALAAGAGALGGAVVGGALSNMLFDHRPNGWGGGGWGMGPGYYDGGDTVIVNNYNTENITEVTENNIQVDDSSYVGGSDWVDMGGGGAVDFVDVGDFGGGGDW